MHSMKNHRSIQLSITNGMKITAILISHLGYQTTSRTLLSNEKPGIIIQKSPAQTKN